MLIEALFSGSLRHDVRQLKAALDAVDMIPPLVGREDADEGRGGVVVQGSGFPIPRGGREQLGWSGAGDGAGKRAGAGGAALGAAVPGRFSEGVSPARLD